eukprot:s1_g2063.t1
MVARVGGTGVGFLIQLALVRLMTPTDYGVYVVALSLAAVLSIFCAFGFPSVATRFIAAYQASGEPSKIRGFLKSALLHLSALALLICIGAVGLLWGSDLVAPEYRLPLFLACLLAPVLALMRLGGALSNTARRFYLTYLPDVTLKPMLLVGGLVAIFFVALPMTSANVLLVHIGAVFVACGALWVFLRPLHEFDLKRIGSSAETKIWRRAAMPMIFVTLLTAFLADIDVLLLSVLLSPEDVGVFSVCLRIMLLIEFGLQTVFQMTTPDLAEAQAREDKASMEVAIRRAQHVTACFSLAALLGVTMMGDTILWLFGERFTAGYQTLLLLVLGQAVRSMFGPVTQVLTVAGAQMRSLFIYGVAFVALVLGNILLVPTMGIEGAAAVLTSAMVLGTALQAVAVSQKAGVSVVRTFFAMPVFEERLTDTR